MMHCNVTFLLLVSRTLGLQEVARLTKLCQYSRVQMKWYKTHTQLNYKGIVVVHHQATKHYVLFLQTVSQPASMSAVHSMS